MSSRMKVYKICAGLHLAGVVMIENFVNDELQIDLF